MPEDPHSISSRDFAFESINNPSRHSASVPGDGGTPDRRHGNMEGHESTVATEIRAGASVGSSMSGGEADIGRTASVELRPRYTPGLSPIAPQSVAAEFGDFSYTPGGPLVWDWDSSIDFLESPTFYEPQGELVQRDLQHQQPQLDFAIPVPLPGGLQSISPPAQTLDSRIHSSPSNPFVGQRLLCPPPPPPLPPQQQQAPRVETEATPTSKRKTKADAMSARSVSFPGDAQLPPSKRVARSRSSSVSGATESGSNVTRPTTARSISATELSRSVETPSGTSSSSTALTVEASNMPSTEGQTASLGTRPVVSTARRAPELASNLVLPAGRVFPIQIGSELFRVSGASISSDAPSYFSHFFGEQLRSSDGRAGSIRTLYIDRDPVIFRDILLHLQGYHVKPRDGPHFVKLFADAQFYSLPRLVNQLFQSDIYIQVGGRHFQIPRDIFSSPGDSPNYFSLGFAAFFSSPGEAFPGLDKRTLLRPPSILPPEIPNRSADTFADILHLLKGYAVHIRDEAHREELLRDARYFHLKGLEQRLLPHTISFNLARETSEILMRLEDIRQSGISFEPDSAESIVTPAVSESTATVQPGISGVVQYARPFVDETSYELVLEIGGETTLLDRSAMRVEFTGQTKARVASLFQVIANKMNLPVTQPLGLMMVASGGGIAAQPVSPSNSGISGDRVRARIEADAFIELDGAPFTWPEIGFAEGRRPSADEDIQSPAESTSQAQQRRSVRLAPPASSASSLSPRPPPAKRRRTGDEEKPTDWAISKGHWRLRVEPTGVEGLSGMEVVMCAVRLEAFSGERAKNARRAFLTV